MGIRASIAISALVMLAAASVWLNWPREELPEGPPPLQAEQIAGTVDALLIATVVDDLRWKLAVVPIACRQKWRSWPEAARHVYALSSVISEPAAGAPPVFPGFAALVAAPVAQAPALAEIAYACAGIGADPCAAIVGDAVAIAERLGLQPGEPVAQPGVFADLDNRLRRQMAVSGINQLLRSYIRSHADEIAAAIPPR